MVKFQIKNLLLKTLKFEVLLSFLENIKLIIKVTLKNALINCFSLCHHHLYSVQPSFFFTV